MTTVLSVRRGGEVALGGDGQVTLANTVVKQGATKIRRLAGGTVLAGFAGSTADALTLFHRLEGKLEEHGGQLLRASVELTRDWRTDKYLRRLEALMAVVDSEVSLLISGSGDVIEPEDGLLAIGSGGGYALAAARALADSGLSAGELVSRALTIAAGICVYTNDRLTVEVL